MRYCKNHEGVARKFFDERNLIEDVISEAKGEDEDLIIVKILNKKSTRQGKFCEVSLFYLLL